jgi:hypothetical protein
MKCGKLFCQYFQEKNTILVGDWMLKDFSGGKLGHQDELERTAHVVVPFLLQKDILEGELEPLLDLASQALDFSLSPDIMRTLEIPDHHCKEALAFAMVTHGRLGVDSALHDLPGELVRRVAMLAHGHPWGIFKRDVSFPEFLNHVARHVARHASLGLGSANKKQRDWILQKCSTCKRWRKLPAGLIVDTAELAAAFSCADADRCLSTNCRVWCGGGCRGPRSPRGEHGHPIVNGDGLPTCNFFRACSPKRLDMF